MRTAWLPALTLMCFPLIAVPANADDAKKEQELLQGKWVAVGGERDGQANDDVKGDVLSIAGDKLTVTRAKGGEEPPVTFKLDPSKKPRHMDVTAAGGLMLQAIYELDGENLKLCYAAPGADRPTEFAAKAGSKRIFVALKRMK